MATEPSAAPAPAIDDPGVQRVLRSPGRPLDSRARRFFEPQFGRSFGDVRVHADGEGDESARRLGAAGYAFGRHVVVSRSTPAASLPRLLAHELVHVVQDSAGPTWLPGAGIAPPDDAEEREAESAAEAAVSGGSVSVRRARSPALLRRQNETQTRPAATTPVLDTAESLLVYRWLSKWRIDHEPGEVLDRRLTADHAENIARIAEAIWLRRIARSGERVDPRLVLRGPGDPEPDEVRALRIQEIRPLYDHAVRIAEQHLEHWEETFVETSIAQIGSSPTPAATLTGNEPEDTAALAEAILCSRLGLLFGGPIDPSFCSDRAATRSNPIFTAFRATVVAPIYEEIRQRPGRALAQALDENRLAAGAHTGQIRQIAETGVVRERGETIVPSLRLLRLLETLAGATTPRRRGTTPDFVIVSLLRPDRKGSPHGGPNDAGLRVGRAVDIIRFAGHNIDITGPADAVAAIAAVIRALPPGCYSLGLPRPPRTDPDGGSEDSQRHQRFYLASTAPPQRPVLRPIGIRAIADNPFLPAVALGHCPGDTTLAASLAALGSARTELTAATTEAAARGAHVLCMFPDGPDHLHIQIDPCPTRGT